MDQKEIVDNTLDIQVIYYIESQIIDNENADKIIWNSQLKGFDQLINQDQEVQVLGLYGVKSTILEFLEKKLQCTIKFPEKFIFYSKRGMICLIQYYNTYYLAFIGPDEYFLQEIFKESIEIMLYRFLKDICNKIILLPSEQIMKNWKPYNSHFYEDNKLNCVEKFKFSKENNIKLEKITIKIHIRQQQIEEINQIKNSFENILTSQGVKKSNQYRIEDIVLQDLFIQILQEKQADKVDFTQFPYQVQNIFQNQLEILLTDINQLYVNYYNEIYSKLFRGPFKQYFLSYQKIPNLFDLIIKFLWQRLGIHEIEYKEEEDLQLVQKYIITYNQNQKIFILDSDLMNNFKALVDEYLNILINLYDNNNQQSISYYLKKFINDIRLEAEKVNYVTDFLVQTQQFQLIPVYIDIENSQNVEIMVKQDQQDILVVDYGDQIHDYIFYQICYYCKTLNQKLDMYICQLVHQNQQSYQYIWVIDDNNSQYKILYKFKQSIKQELLFYYNSQNSKLYTFNSQIGLTIIQFSEKGKICLEERSIQWKIWKDFKQLCYLHYFDCFILQGSDGILYKFQNNDLDYEVLKLNCDGNESFKNYKKIMSTGTGYYFCLINSERCDFYNFNNQLVDQIKFESYKFDTQNIINDIYLLSDNSNWYLCMINVRQQICIMLKEFNQDKKTIPKQNNNHQKKKQTNPFLDLLKGSMVKFGPLIQIIPSNQQIVQLYMSSEQKQDCDKLENYFQIQKIDSTYHLVKTNIFNIVGTSIKINDFIFALISRGSMQLCTIRNANLIPLEKGLIHANRQGFQKKISITDKINQLSFGIFEILTTLKGQKIFIISIMGKQSLGKSYLLNRIFGTRFGVSSARCTDGIWISFSKINDIIFVVLDCEGLLGARRTSEEEFKLLQFVTSLSDYTILNQDLNFNRNLEHLLHNLPQLRGKILFQGQLMIIIRDVSTDGREAAKNENYNFLERIKNNKNGNFISNIFKDQFSVMIMNNFQETIFEQQIIELKNDFINEALNIDRWDSIQQVIKSMKILLVQLEVNDHRTLEDIEIEHLIDMIQKLSTSLWFSKQDGDLERIDMYKEDISFQNLLVHYLPICISSLQHNKQLEKASEKIQEFFEKRIQLINDKLAIQYKQLKEEEIINKLKQQIINHLKNFANKYQLCGQKCHKCHLICRLKLNHSAKEYQAQLDISKYMETQKDHQEKLLQDLINNGLPSQFSEEQFTKQKEIMIQLQEQLDNLKSEIEYIELTEKKQYHLDSINKILGIQLYDEQKFRNFPLQLLKLCGLKLEQNLKFEDFLQKQQKLLTQELYQNVEEIQRLKELLLQKNKLSQEYERQQELLHKELIEIEQNQHISQILLQDLSSDYKIKQSQLIEELDKESSYLDLENFDPDQIIQQILQKDDISDEKLESLKNTIQKQVDLDTNIKIKNKQIIQFESDMLTVKQKQKELYQKMNSQKNDQTEWKFQDSQIINDKLSDKINQKYMNEDKLNKITNSLQNYQKILEHKQMLDEVYNKLNNFLSFKFPKQKLNELKCQQEDIKKQIRNSNNYIQSHMKYQSSIEAYKQLEAQKQIQQLILNQTHDCCRDSHNCDQDCQCCQNNKTKCKFKSGHSDSHLCENLQHYCNELCLICKSKCQYEFNHTDSIKHDCLVKHQCHEKCKFCSVMCDINLSDKHQIHQCSKINCGISCYFNVHYFEEKLKCQNSCHQQHNQAHKDHICKNEQHQCFLNCDQKGICQIGNYTEEIKQWQNSIGSFNYIIYKQNDVKKQCQYQIKNFQTRHDGPHICNAEFHTCDKRCPECNAFCTKVYDHPGKHLPHSHRNKDQQQFTALTGSCRLNLQIQEENLQKYYNIGECAEPETCSKSCSRRSRAHFHLIECAGNEDCLSKLLNKNGVIVARHQSRLYQGAKKHFDEILCEQYWEYKGWEHPVNDIEQREKISECNYYCSKCSNNEKLFCTLKAWHNNSNDYKDHKIMCSEQHKFKGIDIAFVIDTTRSMDKYIHIVKQSIEKFVSVSNRIPDPQAIQYSIVSYTDHNYYNYQQIDQQVTKSINFTNHQNALNFLDNLQFEYSSDVCEAMLDGLDEANRLNWRLQSTKYLFIVADAPPHGLIHHNSYVNLKYDNYPQGCPCGLNEKYVLENLKAKKINIVVLKLNEELNLTINIFKQFANVTEIRDINQDDYVQQMEKIVCLELCNYEITLAKIQ